MLKDSRNSQPISHKLQTMVRYARNSTLLLIALLPKLSGLYFLQYLTILCEELKQN